VIVLRCYDLIVRSFSIIGALLLWTSLAGADTLGGAGESCRAASDCKLGLKCIQQTCVDPREGTTCGASSDCGGELKCKNNKCVSGVGGSPAAQTTAETKPSEPSQWMKFELAGVHPFIGLAWMGGPATAGTLGNGGRWDPSIEGSFVFAARGGVYIDRHELAIELSPMTYAYYHPITGPAFQVNGTYGYSIPLMRSGGIELAWPLRLGVGTFFGNVGSHAYFQIRADAVGLTLRVGHLLFDFYMPSYRVAVTNVDNVTGVLLSWEIGAGVSYAF
jgi:hypothetical protein